MHVTLSRGGRGDVVPAVWVGPVGSGHSRRADETSRDRVATRGRGEGCDARLPTYPAPSATSTDGDGRVFALVEPPSSVSVAPTHSGLARTSKGESAREPLSTSPSRDSAQSRACSLGPLSLNVWGQRDVGGAGRRHDGALVKVEGVVQHACGRGARRGGHALVRPAGRSPQDAAEPRGHRVGMAASVTPRGAATLRRGRRCHGRGSRLRMHRLSATTPVIVHRRRRWRRGLFS